MMFHQQLNDKFWDKDNDNQMRPEVLAKLKEIANAFIEYIEIPEDAVLDIVVTGSSASYNYNKYSDLDLHIVVDYDKIHEDCPLVEGYLGALKNTFNKEHDIFIKDVPVELYAEKKDQGTVHNGLYSVQQEEWIDRPEKIEPTDNDAAVEAKYQEIKDMVDKCDDSEAATELLEKIYTMRKAGLAESGEFCTENLAFKKLRNEGCMDKLRQLKKEQIDKQLSLESYNENVDNIVIDNYLNMLIDGGHLIDSVDSKYVVQVFTNKELQRLVEFDDVRKAASKFIEFTDIYTKDEDVVLFKQMRDNGKDIKTIDSTWLNVSNKNESIKESWSDKFIITCQTKEDPELWEDGGEGYSMKEVLPKAEELYNSGKYSCVEIWKGEAIRPAKRLGKLNKKDPKVDYKPMEQRSWNYRIANTSYGDKNESINEKLEEKEYQGCKYTILPDGKYCSIKIYAPKGYSFKNGDTWYSTETELKKADKKANDIIDNEIELKESIKEDYTDIKPNTKQFDIVDRDGYSIDTLYVTPLENGHFDYWTDEFSSVSEMDSLKDIIDDVKESHLQGPGGERVKIVGLNKKAFKNEPIKENKMNESSIIDRFKEMVNKIAKDFKEEGYPKSKKFLLDFVNEEVNYFMSNNKGYKINISTDNGTAVLTLVDARPVPELNDMDQPEDLSIYQARINAERKTVKFTDLENSNYAYESLNNNLQQLICEAIECKEPYETQEEINGFKLCSFFGYHYANAVYVEEKETGKTVGWDQYENELYLEGPNMETKTYELVKQPELTANVEEVKNMLPSILADGNIQDFPVYQFLEKISQINKDILENYPIYWDKNHEGNREPIKNEDVATLTDKVDQANNDLQDIIKTLSNEALQEPIEIGTRVGTPDGQITGTVKEVNVANKTVKIDTDEVPGKGKEEKEFKIEELDNIIKEALEE